MSNLDKANVKIGTAHEIGVRMDDALEGARSDVFRCDGAAAVIARITDSLNDARQRVQRDIDAGVIDMAQGAQILEGVKMASAVVSDHAMRTTAAKTMNQGRVTGLEQALAVVVQIKAAEEVKASVIIASAQAAGVSPEDLSPAPTIKQQRASEPAAAPKKGGGPGAKNSR